MPELQGGPAAKLPPIHRDGGRPVFDQLAELLRQQILAGVYHPGERLPSESMLVETYQVSKLTIRRAINLLAAQNVISTAQGRGTFVKEVDLGSASFDLTNLKELFDDTRTTVKILEARFLPADERVARKLQLKLGQRCVYIRRLLAVQDQPLFYHRGYLIYDPTRPVMEAEMQVTDLKGILQGSGSPLIKSGELFLSATVLNQEEAQTLQISSLPAAGMMLEHIFCDFEDRPVSWGWFVCSSEHLCLHTHLGIEKVKRTRDERTR
jgi:DNA-binding GntR family transcriptional regulator